RGCRARHMRFASPCRASSIHLLSSAVGGFLRGRMRALPHATEPRARSLRLVRATLGSVLLACSCATAVRADVAWMRDLQAARAAMASGDRPSATRHFAAADSVFAGHAGAKAALAGLAARDGRHDDALRWLRAFAATGLARPAFVDTVFRLWGAEPQF